jgi:surfactin synthase thioesterase subunit
MAGTHYDEIWIRRYQPAPGAPSRLLCLPHAGGSATWFFPVAQALAPRVDVLAVQYPGRQDRLLEPGVTDIVELAEQITASLPVGDTRPLGLLGHSMGASVALEVARRLDPAVLFVSGRRAPDRVRNDGVHLLPQPEFIARLQRLGGSGAQIFGDAEFLELVLPAIRSDYKAAETYRYRPGAPLRCAIRAFAGTDDAQAPPVEMRHWARFTTGPFDLHEFPGGHFFLADHLPAVLRLIADDLANCAMRVA